MEFQEIIQTINEKVRFRNDYLTVMQQERAKYRRSKRIAKNKFLNVKRHFVGKRKYTFHSGGSNEFQFNIGVENGDVLRFGLAFSLETSKSINDPVKERTPEIKRFNQLFSENPKLFDGLEMFIYNKKDQKLYEGQVREIKESEIAIGNFIFLGGITNKVYTQLSEDDLNVIIDRMAALFPIYNYVQHGFKKDIRICRVTFNQNSWVAPSGREGKSRNLETHEGKYGFGYDEWLLNLGYEIDGYHYGFLESKFFSAYKNRIFDLHLYTIRHDSGQRFWLGKISDCSVIDEEEAKKVLMQYEKNGWKDNMISDLERVQSDSSIMKHNWNHSIFNIKFRLKDLDLLDQLLEVSKEDKTISTARYQLSQSKKASSDIEEASNLSDINNSKTRKEGIQETTGRRSAETYTITYLHEEISRSLEEYLRKEQHLVEFEKSTRYRTSIDMVSEFQGTKVIYEIKTAHTAKTCLREAFGQLIEYSFFPDQALADKLAVVGIHKPKLNDIKYIKHLRKVTSLNLYYWHFDKSGKTLIKEY